MPGYSHILTSARKQQDYEALFPRVPKLERSRHSTANRKKRVLAVPGPSVQTPVMTSEKKSAFAS